jgi:hypothetical protein
VDIKPIVMGKEVVKTRQALWGERGRVRGGAVRHQRIVVEKELSYLLLILDLSAL